MNTTAFVGCSSASKIDDKFVISSNKIAKILLANGYDLVFGACNQGLMDAIEMKRRAEIDKPILVIDEFGFYAPFIKFLENMQIEKFSSNATELISYIRTVEDFKCKINSI